MLTLERLVMLMNLVWRDAVGVVLAFVFARKRLEITAGMCYTKNKKPKGVAIWMS